jgi:hypothetical protein
MRQLQRPTRSYIRQQENCEPNPTTQPNDDQQTIRKKENGTIRFFFDRTTHFSSIIR